MPRPQTELEREAEAFQKQRSAGLPTGGYTQGTIENGKYYVEDDSGKREVTPEEYARLRGEPRRAHNAPTPGLEDLDAYSKSVRTPRGARPSVQDRAREAMSELNSFKKGGKVKVPKSKISTAGRSKKSPAW